MDTSLPHDAKLKNLSLTALWLNGAVLFSIICVYVLYVVPALILGTGLTEENTGDPDLFGKQMFMYLLAAAPVMLLLVFFAIGIVLHRRKKFKASFSVSGVQFVLGILAALLVII